jgi:hypothetical protein
MCLREFGDYNGKWIKDEILVHLFEEHSVECQLEQRICSVLNLNRACGTARISCINEIQTPNQFGVFRHFNRQKVVTSDTPNNKCQYKKVYYYFIVTNVNSIPHNTIDWFNKTVESINCLCRPSTRLMSSVSPTTALSFKHVQQNSTNHKRLLTLTNDSEVGDIEIVEDDKDLEDSQRGNKQVRISDNVKTTSQKITTQDKWDSPEALVFFVKGQGTPKSDIQTQTGEHDSSKHTIDV